MQIGLNIVGKVFICSIPMFGSWSKEFALRW